MNKLKPILSARKDCTISYTIVILAFILIQTMIATGNITSSLKGQLVPICAYIVMAISLNLTVGILGELSLGHAGFMSVLLPASWFPPPLPLQFRTALCALPFP